MKLTLIRKDKKNQTHVTLKPTTSKVNRQILWRRALRHAADRVSSSNSPPSKRPCGLTTGLFF